MLAAFILGLILLPLGWTIGMLICLYKGNFDYARECAFTIDQSGGVICKHLFNPLLINKHGYKFSDPDKTISYVLGRNYLDNTLTDLGLLINNGLNWWSPEHTINAVNKNQ